MEDYPVVEENHPADIHENRNDNLSDPSNPSSIDHPADIHENRNDNLSDPSNPSSIDHPVDTHEKTTDQQTHLDPSSIHYTADTHEKTTDQQTSSPVTEKPGSPSFSQEKLRQIFKIEGPIEKFSQVPTLLSIDAIRPPSVASTIFGFIWCCGCLAAIILPGIMSDINPVAYIWVILIALAFLIAGIVSIQYGLKNDGCYKDEKGYYYYNAVGDKVAFSSQEDPQLPHKSDDDNGPFFRVGFSQYCISDESGRKITCLSLSDIQKEKATLHENCYIDTSGQQIGECVPNKVTSTSREIDVMYFMDGDTKKYISKDVVLDKIRYVYYYYYDEVGQRKDIKCDIEIHKYSGTTFSDIVTKYYKFNFRNSVMEEVAPPPRPKFVSWS
jgi:hypothetical protein